MDYPWAVPGAKVVCVHRKPLWDILIAYGCTLPKERGVYTVREVYSYKGLVGVRLDEIMNPNIPFRDAGLAEPSFGVKYFRPLVTKTQEQDIEMFRKIVNQEPVTA